jgi:hypothetical protein
VSDVSLPRTAYPSAAIAQTAFALCAVTLLSSIFLQKIALPGTGGYHPLNLVVFPALTLLAFVLTVIEVNTATFVWYALLVVAGAISLAVSPSAQVSALSLGYLLVVQFPLIFRLVPSEFSHQRLLSFVSTVGCICALVGVLQFAAQFIVGTRIAFFLDTSIPESLTLKGFNSLIPLYWSSPVFKSNGFFFLEPSFFCQFVAVAVVAELFIGARMLRLLMLAAGLISSYSGTGLTMLALFAPFYFFNREAHGRVRLLVTAVIVALVVMFFGDEISIDAFTRRFGEFSNEQSSGWARFLSMFSVLQTVVFSNDFTFLTGRGPGTVQEQFQYLSYNAFDATWGKVIYEYGLVGTIIYAFFFYSAACEGAKGLRFAVGYTYLFLGGYLLNPSILMQVAALVVWFGQERKDLVQSPPYRYNGNQAHVASISH